MVAGGPFGTGLAGGVSMIFGDQLSDRQIFAAIQANGTVKDIGGALQYYNMKSRWNYGAGIEHVPYLTGQVYLQDTTIDVGGGQHVAGYSVNQLLQRVYIDQAAVFTQYPFSMTKRLEFTANITHYGFDTELFKTTFVGNTIVDQTDEKQSSIYKPIWFAEPSLALVGDNSFEAFTSPVQGQRYRLQVTPTFGSVQYTNALLDYRKYYFLRPFTFAVRGLSLGRYGSGAEDPNTTWPIYLGEETLIRGYGYGSFNSDECQVDNPPAEHADRAGGLPGVPATVRQQGRGGQRRIPHSAVRHRRLWPAQLPLPADGSLAVLRRAASRTRTRRARISASRERRT